MWQRCIFVLLCFTGSLLGASVSDPVAQAFLRPPASARPWVYWFWLNGNSNSNGITADLEAMARVGIGGVLIMEVDQGTPKGPADFGSPVWRDLFKHVCREASRLGLQVNMNNDAGWSGSGGPWITPELSMQKLVWSETNLVGPAHFEGILPWPTATTNYYQDIAVLAFPTPAPGAHIDGLAGKAAFESKRILVGGTFPSLPADQTIARESITQIDCALPANDCFIWEVPRGEWTVLRLGHTSTGKDNHPAPEAGRGLESDKLSKAATDAMFDGLMGKLIADNKALEGKVLVGTHIDSWESGSQNWTLRFREEFQRLRGYDPLPFLPVITGRAVESLEVSERFLWDVRQTVSDLLVENYAGEFRRLAHQNGLRLSIEAYKDTPCVDLTYAGQADEPMAEFWSWGVNTTTSCLEMSSAAHVYGQRILAAEAFTASDGEKWQHHPATIKALGDWAFCEGINRFVIHRFALQPWGDRAPGMSMGPWGLHYERTETWWEMSSAWHQYLARCQYLLRQGLFVADICFLQPEGSPQRFTPTMPWRTGANTPDRPRYDFDGCPPDVLLNQAHVKDGDLVLADGMTYRVLVLPQVETMTPALLAKVGDLVRAGATVIGPPPRKSPSLTGYPQCDAQVQELAARWWRDAENPEMVKAADAEADGMDSGGHHVIWQLSFRSQPPSASLTNLVQKAKWIWYPEGKLASSTPPRKRYFRRLVAVPTSQEIQSAQLSATADNWFEVWVNGKSLGMGGEFQHIYSFDATACFHPGTNVVAVKAVNGSDETNRAGVIGALVLKFRDGSSLAINSDGDWEAALGVAEDWMTGTTSTASWVPAMELGSAGTKPWGEFDNPAGPPYVYPAFEAVTGVLHQMQIAPDFEADSRLRFIHRRDGPVDIYFVANSQTNWLQAECGFRVAGKLPEIWDPMTGHISRPARWEQRDGRTFLPLSFEPVGSVFVVFREPSSGESGQRERSRLLQVSRDGRKLLPGPNSSVSEAPVIETAMLPNHRLQVVAREPGFYDLSFASGKALRWEVKLPAAFEISGPWQVQFQPNRGAPAQATFDRLEDWSQDTQPGIRYFSGTAVYHRTFTLPSGYLGHHRRLYLDLGQVAVMARVVLNGHDLGIVWKSPYRVEITDVLRSGRNALEVTVANLWINRQIGDEQLPEDSDRKSDGTLRAWPKWLEDGLPSPTGRISFTTWRVWKGDSPLQPSGLLGPVAIRAEEELSMATR